MQVTMVAEKENQKNKPRLPPTDQIKYCQFNRNTSSLITFFKVAIPIFHDHEPFIL